MLYFWINVNSFFPDFYLIDGPIYKLSWTVIDHHCFKLWSNPISVYLLPRIQLFWGSENSIKVTAF